MISQKKCAGSPGKFRVTLAKLLRRNLSETTNDRAAAAGNDRVMRTEKETLHWMLNFRYTPEKRRAYIYGCKGCCQTTLLQKAYLRLFDAAGSLDGIELS